METLGVYVSVPFCRAKCSFCNFASDTFAEGRMDGYVGRLCGEIAGVRGRAEGLEAELPGLVDSVYFGGGTPSLLEAGHFRAIFAELGRVFEVGPAAEITVECAPGQLAAGTLEEVLRLGVNRVSLGVQSFVDAEARAVGRLHTGAMCLAEIARLRAAGVENLSVDLIAGLPEQTAGSWRESVEAAVATGVPHVSVYMLEVDEGSRLGREALAGGGRYGAGLLPGEEEVAEFYLQAIEMLGAAGVEQYEISNFARGGRESRHNLKYWQRLPYVGFGMDAHSMLRAGEGAVRFANTDDLDGYMGGPFGRVGPVAERVGREGAFEEALFLGLRLNEGVSVAGLRAEFGEEMVGGAEATFGEMDGLVWVGAGRVGLTGRGRLLSNEVFGRLLEG